MSERPLSSLPKAEGAPWGKRGRAGAVFAGNVVFENVSFRARDKLIIDNISLELQAGRIASLLGPSGCGKTTLLRLIAGVLRPSSGRILIDGVEMAGPRVCVPSEKRNVGLMFQDFALFPHMTALQNVAYGLYALDRQEARAVALRALDRVGLLALADRYPALLSGGEQQRVALARAMVPRPQVLLMDEPFSGLDQRLRESVRDETLALVRETRATCLLVTHDPQEAMAFADRIFLMRKGRLVQQGSPEDLIAQPADAAVARFFRSYNTFQTTVSGGRITTPLGLLKAGTYADGDLVTVLVPHDGIEMKSGEGPVMGHLVESRYLGDVRLLRFAVAGLDQLIEVSTFPHDVRQPGSMCALALLPDRAQVFPASKSGGD